MAKRILYDTQTNIYAEDNRTFCYNWLINQFDAIHQALIACDYQSPNEYVSKEPTGVVTSEMTAISYQIARNVYSGQIGRTDGRDEIVRQCGMNAGSAGDFITDFLAMMDGAQYARTLNEYSTRYYLEQIEKDYGIDALKRALLACDQHAKYYAALGHGRLAYVERIVQEYREKFSF